MPMELQQNSVDIISMGCTPRRFLELLLWWLEPQWIVNLMQKNDANIFGPIDEKSISSATNSLPNGGFPKNPLHV